ncbi:hypothetical protein NON00_00765 [Roseomonas sp. GC11]|uniref:hypothetical protein n=1 Tax=Roseomonas sp. GC11 TaxID=2950546 RepID=UPI00210A64D6|nr:hypothetical protein [Roseomonas sp. GC11]MCQ4158458.1 hypothetical protein [Roseomonas sp. GC11]
MKRHATPWLLLACAPLLAGCEERWAKPGASPAEYEATRARCEQRLHAQFPPILERVQSSGGYVSPVQTRCSGDANNRRCTTTGGNWVPPSFTTIDHNEDVRERGIAGCLIEQGWRRVE